MNKGTSGEDTGFDVCDECGTATPHAARQYRKTTHERPYLMEWGKIGNPGPCNGTYRQVFLGTTFSSDLLLMRVALHDPIDINMQSLLTQHALGDALTTLAEALLLATSRVLDIHMAELSAGYRYVPGTEQGALFADLFLFDTLSGGAGYADQAGRTGTMEKVLTTTLEILEGCPGNCARSCYECLRYYGNQYYHERLDRHLGAALLRYVRDGLLPAVMSVPAQQRRLFQLQNMLQLDGYSCETGAVVAGIAVPLLVRRGRQRLAIGTYSGLLRRACVGHPLDDLALTSDLRVLLENEYRLDRDVTALYIEIKTALA